MLTTKALLGSPVLVHPCAPGNQACVRPPTRLSCRGCPVRVARPVLSRDTDTAARVTGAGATPVGVAGSASRVGVVFGSLMTGCIRIHPSGSSSSPIPSWDLPCVRPGALLSDGYLPYPLHRGGSVGSPAVPAAPGAAVRRALPLKTGEEESGWERKGIRI